MRFGSFSEGREGNQYVATVQKGQDQPMDFIFYVPPGYESLGGSPLPNVEVTEDPARILTVRFQGDKEVWGDI